MKFSIKSWLGVGAVVGTIVAAGAANAADFTLRWGHYLGNSPFVKIEQDFALRGQQSAKTTIIGFQPLHIKCNETLKQSFRISTLHMN